VVKSINKFFNYFKISITKEENQRFSKTNGFFYFKYASFKILCDERKSLLKKLSLKSLKYK